MDNKWYQKGLDWLLEKDNVDKKWYKRRIVWVVTVVVIVLIMLLNPESKSTEKNEVTGSEIPNVFGVYYEDAIDVLEAEGFEVNAIETDAKSILNNLYKEYDGSPQYYGDRPESFEKGAVFKINDYTQDGVGQLYDNDEMYDEHMVDDDGKVVIYYAKEAYSGSDGTADTTTEETERPTEEPVEQLSFEIVNGQSGEYAKSRTVNKGTEFEETFYEYHIPVGTYTVTNKSSKSACQISICSNDYTKVDGWDEPKEIFGTAVVFANESSTITVEEGQHLNLSDGSETLYFEKQ